MPRAVFTHRPHLVSTDCSVCHTPITLSELATDVNVLGVATCQQCHNASDTRADCATCHIYHPASVARLFKPF